MLVHINVHQMLGREGGKYVKSGGESFLPLDGVRVRKYIGRFSVVKTVRRTQPNRIIINTVINSIHDDDDVTNTRIRIELNIVV